MHNDAVVEQNNGNVVELIDNFESSAMAKVVVHTIPDIMQGKSLVECKLKALYGINVVMVEREGKLIEVNAHTSINQDDELIVFGPLNNINYLFTGGEDNSSVNTATDAGLTV